MTSNPDVIDRLLHPDDEALDALAEYLLEEFTDQELLALLPRPVLLN